MRARTLARRTRAVASAPSAPAAVEPLSPAGLVFLRGRDADARLRELAAGRLAARPLLGALSGVLLDDRVYEALGYRSLGDYGRERLGIAAKTVREWARVWRRLGELPLLRQAFLAGEIGFAVTRRVVGLATPETEAACLETVRGRTLRAVQAIVAAVREADAEVPTATADLAEAEPERVLVRLSCTPREALLWRAALELARRVAGEELPVWRCAEMVAAEAASAIGAEPLEGVGAGVGAGVGEGAAGIAPAPSRAATPDRTDPAMDRAGPAPDSNEPGLRDHAFPGLRWSPAPPARLPAELAAMVEGLDQAPPLALARTEHRAPAVAIAFRQGRIHAFQAQVLARVADLGSARVWVERARAVTLRRLEEDSEGAPPEPAAIAFPAPPEVAEFFHTMLARTRSLERVLAHAIRTWVEQGKLFDDYADFERDGFRCTAPGCTGRRNLHSHHIRYRSHEGPDEPWNRTTLCAYHHERALHLERTIRIRGHAPDRLVFALGREPAERFRSGDVRIP